MNLFNIKLIIKLLTMIRKYAILFHLLNIFYLIIKLTNIKINKNILND
jgi:hypothetical protein